MKFKVTFKDPDTLNDAISNAIRNTLEPQEGFDEEEVEMVVEDRKKDIEKSVEAWVKYGEYITIEFDTELNTAIVIQNSH